MTQKKCFVKNCESTVDLRNIDVIPYYGDCICQIALCEFHFNLCKNVSDNSEINQLIGYDENDFIVI